MRVITTLMMAFALVAQPFYGLVSSQVANAATGTGIIANNETPPPVATTCEGWTDSFHVASRTTKDNGTLVYGKITRSDSNLDIQWRNNKVKNAHNWVDFVFDNNVAKYNPLAQYMEAQGFPLGNDSDTEFRVKSDVAGEYTYSVQLAKVSGNGAFGSPFEGEIKIADCNPQPIVIGENFNTHSGEDYKGINVGFNIANFTEVSGVTVGLYRDGEDEPFVRNTGTDELYAWINEDNVMHLSTPFYTTGTASDVYWAFGNHTWIADDAPVMAKITVTGTNNSGDSATDFDNLVALAEPNGVTFASLILAKAVMPPAEPLPSSPPLPSFQPIETVGSISPLPEDFTTSRNATAAIFTTPTFGNQAAVAGNDSDILGTQTTNESSINTGDNLAAIAPSSDGWKFFGIAWYWLALIAAAIATVWHLIARRRNQDA